MSEKTLSLRDLVLKAKETIFYALSKWYIILLCGLVLGAIFALPKFFKHEVYSARLTLMMDETKAGARGGNLQLQLLGDLFGQGKGDNNLAKVLELFETRAIIHKTLFDTIEMNAKNDFLANHMLELYGVDFLVDQYKGLLGGYKVGWVEPLLDNQTFRFTHRDLDKFNPTENIYLRLIYEHVVGNPQAGIENKLFTQIEESSGIMAVNMLSYNQEVTIGVLNNIYYHLSDFFIEKSVEKQKKIFELMTVKKDSVLAELKIKEYALANFKDSNRKLVTVKGYLQQLRLEREVQILNVMYTEVVKQLEATDFTLKSMTPVVQIIDKPRRPIIPFKPSWTKALTTGFIVGAFLSFMFFVMRSIIGSVIDFDSKII